MWLLSLCIEISMAGLLTLGAARYTPVKRPTYQHDSDWLSNGGPRAAATEFTCRCQDVIIYKVVAAQGLPTISSIAASKLTNLYSL